MLRLHRRKSQLFPPQKFMLKKILIVVVVLILALVVVIVLQPSHFHITRSATIPAPASVVFAQVNELKKWEAWSPWMKLDPNAKSTYEGPAAGKDAAMAWDGNSSVGAGKMTITDSKPNELVQLRLDFEKPLKGTNTAEFNFKEDAGQTTVTWSMDGENNFIGKAIGLFLNCDKMVGGQFEKGLADLKSASVAANGK